MMSGEVIQWTRNYETDNGTIPWAEHFAMSVAIVQAAKHYMMNTSALALYRVHGEIQDYRLNRCIRDPTVKKRFMSQSDRPNGCRVNQKPSVEALGWKESDYIVKDLEQCLVWTKRSNASTGSVVPLQPQQMFLNSIVVSLYSVLLKATFG